MRQTLGALALLVLGCTANITGNDGPSGTGPGLTGTDPGGGASATSSGGSGSVTAACTLTPGSKPDIAARIRRLTRLELENTLVDLVGAAAGPLARDLEPDTFAIGYSTGDERGVSSNYVDALKSVAERATLDLKAVPEFSALAASCSSDVASASACAEAFVKTFGARALRRPLTQAELDGLMGVYDSGRATAAAADPGAALRAGLGYVARALLQSSSFIFRTELGTPGPSTDSVTLTPYEIAAAISYALTASAPDAELGDQAASGMLTTPEQLSAQGRRLLQAYPERFARQAERFVREWLTIDVASPAWNKDAKLYPEASAVFKTALDQETQLFLRDWAQMPSFQALLSSSRSFVSKDNAPAYGIDRASNDFVATELDASQRAGILTLPSYLGSQAHSDTSSPVLRGVAVMRKFLCLEPPPVPAMVPPLPPADASAAQTTRQRFEQHTSLAFCKSCHQTFDPMGLSFEHYDAIGRYREQENGVPVDSSGALVGTASTDAKVADAVELAKLLAKSPEVHACFARQAYRFTVGRRESDASKCALAGYAQSLGDQALDLRELMLSLVTTPAAFARIPLTPDP